MRLLSIPILAVAALLLCSSGAANDKKKDPDQIGNRNVGKGINFYSIAQEIALGKQLAEEVRRQSKLVDDPIATEYVNRLGQNLVRNSDATIPFTFELVEGEQLNAFALPGGFVFVYTGLIEAAETEAELAGAMAHEIAHVTARHHTRQASRGKIADYATIPLILMGGVAGVAARQGAGLAIPLTFLKFDRGFETEADMLGLQYMYKTGYDPTASIDLFERMLSLEKRKPGIIARVFDTHPMTGDRIVNAQKNIAEMLPNRPEFVVTTSEFNEVRERVKSSYVPRRGDDPNRPRLRKAPSAVEPGQDAPAQDSDEKPTLKRRDLVD
jgi:beta-barrel assembly-enhancing protease